MFIEVEENTTCCYAQQDKAWVHGPGQEPWEVYVVKADSATFGEDGHSISTCDPRARVAKRGRRIC
jgi:hypothetical protein